MPNVVSCRSCGAAIFWTKSAKTGSAMPLDAQPVDAGNIYLVDGLAHVKSGDAAEQMMQGPMYQSHFATCPNAAHHRKPKKESKE